MRSRYGDISPVVSNLRFSSTNPSLFGAPIPMNDVPEFEDAVGLFRNFLAEEDLPANVFWVFREDIWKRSLGDVVLRFPSHVKNLALAKKVFAEGRKMGLVEIR